MYGGDYPSDAIRARFEAAEEQFSFRNYDAAYTAAQALAEEFPEQLEGLRLLGLCADPLRRESEILAQWNPENAPPERLGRALYLRGWLATLAGDFRSAARDFNAARQKLTHPSMELERAALVARRLDYRADEEQLFADYRALMERYPGNPLLHLSYIQTYNFHSQGSKKWEEAVAEAMKLRPRSPEIILQGVAVEEDRFWRSSTASLALVDEGLKEFPRSVDLILRKVMILRQLGRQEEALAVVREAIAMAPNHADLRIDEVDLLGFLGRWEEAIARLQQFDELKWQPRYVEGKLLRLGRYLHYAGRPEEAIKAFAELRAVMPGSHGAAEAGEQISHLLRRKPTDRVQILTAVPTCMQSGNYCGPATVRMIMGFWGRSETQEQIAARVYTGIAGTPPQVIHNYARLAGFETREFHGDEETWKRVLDAGYPILWLQMLGSRGAHYRVVVGYDEVRSVWIVQDPNQFGRAEFEENQLQDDWFLPDLRRSIVIFPKDRADDPILRALGPTPALLVSNWVLYVATGSNLFVGLFPALLVNAAVAAVLAWLLAVTLRAATWPRRSIPVVRIVGVILAFVVVLNLVIGGFRLGEAVSLLLAFHLGMLTLIPLTALIACLRPFLTDFFHPRETIGLCLAVFVAWTCLAFIDQDPWQWIAPVASFAVGLPIILWPRTRIGKAARLAAEGDTRGALAAAAPHGWEGTRYFAAVCMELECLLRAGDAAGFLRRIEAMRGEHWPSAPARALRFYEAIGLALNGTLPSPTQREALREAAAAAPAWGTLSAVLDFLAQDVPDAAQGEVLVGRLGELLHPGLPGFSPTEMIRGRPVVEASLLLVLRRLSEHGSSESRVATLLQERYGLLLRLLPHRTS